MIEYVERSNCCKWIPENKYSREFELTKRAMWDWCRDNIHQDDWRCDKTPNGYFFYFDNKDDAVAFKLMYG